MQRGRFGSKLGNGALTRNPKKPTVRQEWVAKGEWRRLDKVRARWSAMRVKVFL